MFRNTLILIVTLFIAGVSASHAFGNISAHRQPNLALGLIPENGHVYAKIASETLKQQVQENGGEISGELPSHVTDYVKKGLLLEPTDTRALPYLTFENDGSRSNNNKNHTLLTSIAAIDRRNPVANVLLSKSYMERGDDRGGLRFYDIALRTSSAASNVLVPEMVKHLNSDGVIDIYADLLASEPPWREPFWYLAFRTPGVNRSVADLRLALLKKYPDYDPGLDVDVGIIKQQINNGFFDLAYTLHQGLRTLPRYAGEDGSDAFTPLPPFDWDFPNTGDAGAVLEEDKSIAVSALPDVAEITVARRLLKLTGGSYEINAKTDGNDSYELFAQIRCANEDESSSDNEQPRYAIGKEPLGLKFTVDNTLCTFFWLELSVSTNEGADQRGVRIMNALPVNVGV